MIYEKTFTKNKWTRQMHSKENIFSTWINFERKNQDQFEENGTDEKRSKHECSFQYIKLKKSVITWLVKKRFLHKTT